MWQDPVGQITKMDQFLGLDRGSALCQQIAEACRFSKLKKAKDAQIPEDMKDQLRTGAPGVFRKGILSMTITSSMVVVDMVVVLIANMGIVLVVIVATVVVVVLAVVTAAAAREQQQQQQK